MLSLLAKIGLGGLGSGLAKTVGTVAKVVTIGKEHTHNENIERLKQAGSYVGYGRTWWDSLVDGINRLVRPLSTGGVLYWFYFCATDPIAFTASMVALQAMPTAFWGILGTIIVFWFGGKFAEGVMRPKALKPSDLKELLGTIKEIETHGNRDSVVRKED